jgi:DNA-binding NtrC family response regulator
MQARIVAATNRDLVQMADDGSFREDLYYRLNVLSIVVPPLRERPEDIALLAVHFLAAFGEQLGRTYSGFSEGAMERLRSYNWPGNVRELRNTIERAALFATGGLIPADQIELESRPAPSDPNHAVLLPMPSNKIKDMERFLIEKVVNDCAGNRSLAARELGINRTTLYNKLREYGDVVD